MSLKFLLNMRIQFSPNCELDAQYVKKWEVSKKGVNH